ncbi:MAG: PD-(D/E)XK nuclease family protein [Prevotellaceae bacterium]|nr:PD-(D/E)XK nuclease family protein [Prevotellaceae bacterium]
MMDSFLATVAADLTRRFGSNLSGLTIVFPGKRASRFMNDHLARCAEGPVWAPRYATIDEIFQSLSPYTPSDTIRNVCELHKIYATLVPDPLPLDEFYCWGEILMADFDDIDKHLADARKLFSNTADLLQMEGLDYLSDQQLQALKDFFSNFSVGGQTELKARFLTMWRAMPQMYSGLREKLASQGLMYKGALYRMVVERLRQMNDPTSTAPAGLNNGSRLPFGLAENTSPFAQGSYAIVGFNVLDEVETALFSTLQKSGNALFYWDYDQHYLQGDHEAGLFMRDNLQRFPSALQGFDSDNLMGKPKSIRFLSASSDNAQARYLPTWLRERFRPEGRDCESVVVLCDESLLLSVLHSIPSPSEEPLVAPQELNVTMGFPLGGTPVHSYYLALLDLQVRGYDTLMCQFTPSSLKRVTSHPFHDAGEEPAYQPDNASLLRWLAACMENLGKRLAQADSPTVFDQLYTESVFQLYCATNQFLWLTDEGSLPVSRTTLGRLVRQAVQSLSVPFHGDMDRGLQVMGLLETRNLDFRNLLMLSVEEGFMPKRRAETSLIPYCLRSSFHLATAERQTAVFAYYFYRILSRAEDITLVYNETSSGTKQREMSRFLRQLASETSLPIEHLSLVPPCRLAPPEQVVVPKTASLMRQMTERFGSARHDLSPSALSAYLSCPLKFYYQNVALLTLPQDPLPAPDNVLLGTLFHDAAQFFYTHLISLQGGNQLISASSLQQVLDQPALRLACYVDLAFWVDAFHASRYDAYQCHEEREAFLSPYLALPSRAEFYRQVNGLYAAADGDPTIHFSGMNMIVRDVVMQYLIRLLQTDAALAPFQMVALERSVHGTLEIPAPEGETLRLGVGGRIDRLDLVGTGQNSCLRVVDYKTGRRPILRPSSVEAIFQPGATGQEHYYLQTFLYCMLLAEREQLPLRPCLFYITEATDPATYKPTLTLGRETLDIFSPALASEFRQRLHSLVGEIFNPDLPFSQTADRPAACHRCDFCQLCGFNF